MPAGGGIGWGDGAVIDSEKKYAPGIDPEYERGVTHGRNEALDEAIQAVRMYGPSMNSALLVEQIAKLRRDI